MTSSGIRRAGYADPPPKDTGFSQEAIELARQMQASMTHAKAGKKKCYKRPVEVLTDKNIRPDAQAALVLSDNSIPRFKSFSFKTSRQIRNQPNTISFENNPFAEWERKYIREDAALDAKLSDTISPSVNHSRQEAVACWTAEPASLPAPHQKQPPAIEAIKGYSVEKIENLSSSIWANDHLSTIGVIKHANRPHVATSTFDDAAGVVTNSMFPARELPSLLPAIRHESQHSNMPDNQSKNCVRATPDENNLSHTVWNALQKDFARFGIEIKMQNSKPQDTVDCAIISAQVPRQLKIKQLKEFKDVPGAVLSQVSSHDSQWLNALTVMKHGGVAGATESQNSNTTSLLDWPNFLALTSVDRESEYSFPLNKIPTAAIESSQQPSTCKNSAIGNDNPNSGHYWDHDGTVTTTYLQTSPSTIPKQGKSIINQADPQKQSFQKFDLNQGFQTQDNVSQSQQREFPGRICHPHDYFRDRNTTPNFPTASCQCHVQDHQKQNMHTTIHGLRGFCATPDTNLTRLHSPEKDLAAAKLPHPTSDKDSIQATSINPEAIIASRNEELTQILSTTQSNNDNDNNHNHNYDSKMGNNVSFTNHSNPAGATERVNTFANQASSESSNEFQHRMGCHKPIVPLPSHEAKISNPQSSIFEQHKALTSTLGALPSVTSLPAPQRSISVGNNIRDPVVKTLKDSKWAC